jgi:hypothetical protein
MYMDGGWLKASTVFDEFVVAINTHELTRSIN